MRHLHLPDQVFGSLSLFWGEGADTAWSVVMIAASCRENKKIVHWLSLATSSVSGFKYKVRFWFIPALYLEAKAFHSMRYNSLACMRFLGKGQIFKKPSACTAHKSQKWLPLICSHSPLWRILVSKRCHSILKWDGPFQAENSSSPLHYIVKENYVVLALKGR